MRVEHAPDAGRLVIQCPACWRSAPWRGEDHARAAGWRSRYVPSRARAGELVRVWACADCYQAPAPAASSAPSYALPARLLEEAQGRRPGPVGELLEQLLQVDRARAVAYVEALLEARMGKVAKAWWAGWAKRVGVKASARRAKGVQSARSATTDRRRSTCTSA